MENKGSKTLMLVNKHSLEKNVNLLFKLANSQLINSSSFPVL